MSFIQKFAVRNVGRNRRRSLLAVISVTLSIMLIVFLQGMIGGFLDNLVHNYTKNETGHIRIATKEFEERAKFFPVTDNISNPNEIIKLIKQDENIQKYIKSISQRIVFGVLLSHDGNNKQTIAYAGDPEQEKELLMLNKSLLPGGRYIQNEDEAIVGKKLAEDLNYRIGDEIPVMTRGSDYALHLKKFKIVGLFETGLSMYDEMIFQLPLAGAQELLRMLGQAQQIVIMLKNYHNSDVIAQMITEKLSDYDVQVSPWTKIGVYANYVKMANSIYNWIYIVIAFLGAFIIANIMMMVVLERRKEIGIIKSMGFTNGQVLTMFMNEGMLLGFVGSVVGSLIGLGIVTILHFHGIDFSGMMESINFPMSNVIYLRLNLLSIVIAILLGTVTSTIVSFFPSRRAEKMKIVDSLKSV
ncbi:MAG TPA: ABC transporter permease [Candidatus Cloacimonetes bacterium]|nr:ABC transporter permease [Candidatus Cloacimonadota bacterium]HEX37467.1 ABC transporter permease [Candidatus Cloacimonadota bacterium]